MALKLMIEKKNSMVSIKKISNASDCCRRTILLFFKQKTLCDGLLLILN